MKSENLLTMSLDYFDERAEITLPSSRVFISGESATLTLPMWIVIDMANKIATHYKESH